MPASRRDSGAREEWASGWPLAFVSALGIAVSVTALYSLGALLSPIQAATGWSRSEISAGPAFLTVGAVLFGPAVGALVDQNGSRTIALAGLAFYCAALASISLLGSSLTGWLVGWCLIAIGYVAVKPTVWAAAVVKRFEQSRGLALGLVLSGTGIGSALSPLGATILSEMVGWRATYAWMAAGCAILTLPLVFAFFHDRLDTDGGSQSVAVKSANYPAAESRTQIIFSPAFLLMGLACLLSALPSGALVVHFVPILAEQDIAARTAAFVAGFVGIFTVVGRLAAGAVMDRVQPVWIGVGSCIAALLACVILLAAHGKIWAGLAASLLGLSAGAEFGVLAYMIPQLFGHRHFGFLFGIMSAIFTLAVGVGPLIAGIVFDIFGTYSVFMAGAMPSYLIASVCFLLLRKPRARPLSHAVAER